MHKQVIVLRKDLNMRKGKMVAQGAHASMSAILSNSVRTDDTIIIHLDERVKPWLTSNFTKICVYVNNEQELLGIYNEAKYKGLIVSLIKDNGTTEFNGVPTYTAVAVGPDVSEKIDEVTKHLPLL